MINAAFFTYTFAISSNVNHGNQENCCRFLLSALSFFLDMGAFINGYYCFKTPNIHNNVSCHLNNQINKFKKQQQQDTTANIKALPLENISNKC